MAEVHTQNELEERFSGIVFQAIQDKSNNTARSKQQQDFRLGASNIGHCRQQAVLMTRQVPPTDERNKTAAFIGTALGREIEEQLALDHPDWLFQTSVTFKIPSGGELPGHPDVVIPWSACTEEIPQGVLDLKSKAELETIRRYGMSQQQKFQLHEYAAALIDDGRLNPAEPIWLCDVFYDRTGKAEHAYTIGMWYDPAVLNEIDEWINDVKYAVIHKQDASRDMSREWCANWCEWFLECRGHDTDVQGLLTDPEILSSVNAYIEGTAMIAAGKKLQDAAKKNLDGVRGSTGTHNVRPVVVEATEIAGFTRAGYTKLSITPIPKPKVSKKKEKEADV